MDGQDEADEERGEDDWMTEEMRRGGGGASTSWMICIVWGWQR